MVNDFYTFIIKCKVLISLGEIYHPTPFLAKNSPFETLNNVGVRFYRSSKQFLYYSQGWRFTVIPLLLIAFRFVLTTLLQLVCSRDVTRVPRSRVEMSFYCLRQGWEDQKMGMERFLLTNFIIFHMVTKIHFHYDKFTKRYREVKWKTFILIWNYCQLQIGTPIANISSQHSPDIVTWYNRNQYFL